MKKIISFFQGLTPIGRALVSIIIVGICIGGYYAYDTYVPKEVKESAVIAVNDLPPLSYDKNANAPSRPHPNPDVISEVAAPFVIRAEIMGWNAQAGVAYANGGPITTEGSIMEEQGVRLKLMCQNNCSKQGEDIFAFSQDYANGNKNSSKGCHMIAWMGDGVPSYLQDLNERIKKQIGPDYILQAFAGFGASFGEDKAIYKNGSFLKDPQELRGSLFCGVIRDGDWNILMKWADMNQIDVNTDLTTYDPNAINWMQAPDFDYTKAAQQYVAKTKETRALVINGKRTGRDTTVAVDGCVTWFPGDKVAVEGRGGVTVASTKDYGAQMINTGLAPKKWLEDNGDYVKKFILGAFLGGDQVKSHSSALTYASEVQNKIYNDANMTAKDWEDAFRAFEVTNEDNGISMEIGGSRVFNLADAAEYYGLTGGEDIYKVVYNTFGDLCVKAYPEDVSAYPPYEEVVNLSLLEEVYNKNKSTLTAVASLPEFKEGQKMKSVVAAKSVSIEFEFGSAKINPKSYPILEQISNDFLIAQDLLASIEGHTDNVGNSEANKSLSQRRADAVKQWLMEKNPKAFKNKITTIGYGDERPVGYKQSATPEEVSSANRTDSDRKKNRRVEIKLGRS